MDRELPKNLQRKRKLKAIFKYSSIIACVFTLLFFVRAKSEKTAQIEAYMIDTVKVQQINIGFEGFGTIEPFYREVLSAPVSAVTDEVRFLPGDTISVKDTLLIFDLRELLSEYQNLKNEIRIKRYNIAKQEEIISQQGNDHIFQLEEDSIRIKKLEVELEKNAYLFSIGGGAKEEVENSEMNLKLEKLKFKRKKKTQVSNIKKLLYDLQIQNTELRMKEQKLHLTEQKIDKSYLKPKEKGVLLSVDVQPGQQVSKGQEVAVLAGLQTFKVSGHLSAQYSDRIFIGQKVEVKYAKNICEGIVMTYSTDKNNNGLNYQIRLLNSDNIKFIAGIKTELRFIEEEIPNALCIADGGIYTGEGINEVYVFENDYLVRKEIRMGGSSGKEIEIVNGVKPGDRVIINGSFYKEYKDEMRIKYKINSVN